MSLASVRAILRSIPLKQPRHAAGDRIEVAGWAVRLAVNARAKRLTLRFDAARSEFTVVAPNVRRLAEAADFARRRADWIGEQAGVRPPPQPFRPGATIPLRGEAVVLQAAPGKGAARLRGG